VVDYDYRSTDYKSHLINKKELSVSRKGKMSFIKQKQDEGSSSKEQSELLKKLRLPQKPVWLVIVVLIYLAIAYYLWPIVLCVVGIWFINKKIKDKKKKIIFIASSIIACLVITSFWFVKINNDHKVAQQKSEQERIVKEARDQENKKKREEENKAKAQRDQEAKAKQSEETKDLDASVNYNELAFKIQNNEDKNWVNCRLSLNSKYEYRVNGIAKKDSLIISYSDFAKSDGTRFNIFETKVKDLSISCSNEGSTYSRFNYFTINN